MSDSRHEVRTHRLEPGLEPLGDQDPSSNRQQIVFLYGAGLAIGLHLALLHLYVRRSLTNFLMVLAGTLFFTTVTLGLWTWVMPRLSRGRNPRRLLRQMGASILAYALASFLAVEVSALLTGAHSVLRPYAGPDLSFTFSADFVRNTPIVFLLIPVLPLAVLCVTGFNLYWWRILILKARARELRNLAVAAQLSALRAQINPHFLFNSLNSIAQLIRIDPAKAEHCVERLSDLFRHVLTRSKAEFVSVADEMQLAETYLEIERVRFGEDLAIRTQVEPETRFLQMPGLILQPLVENAVKHGISQKIGGGEVFIGARREGGDLLLTVRDTGQGIRSDTPALDRGVGLRSVQERLVRLYGPSYTPSITSIEGEGTTVNLRIPVTGGGSGTGAAP